MDAKFVEQINQAISATHRTGNTKILNTENGRYTVVVLDKSQKFKKSKCNGAAVASANTASNNVPSTKVSSKPGATAAGISTTISRKPAAAVTSDKTKAGPLADTNLTKTCSLPAGKLLLKEKLHVEKVREEHKKSKVIVEKLNEQCRVAEAVANIPNKHDISSGNTVSNKITRNIEANPQLPLRLTLGTKSGPPQSCSVQTCDSNVSAKSQESATAHGHMVDTKKTEDSASSDYGPSFGTPIAKQTVYEDGIETSSGEADDTVSWQLYDDGTLVTNDKTGSNCTTVNLKHLNLNPATLKNSDNVEIVIVQDNGKHIKTVIGLENLRSAMASLATASSQKVPKSGQTESKSDATVTDISAELPSTEVLAPDAYKSQNIKEYPCQICQKVFSAYKLMRKHYNFVHVKSQRKVCLKCKLVLSSACALKRHVKRKHSGHSIQFKCMCCKEEFSQKEEVINHLKKVHKQVADTCEFFDKKNDTLKELKKHFKAVKKDTAEGTSLKSNLPKYVCKYCGLKSASSLIRHLKTHEKQRCLYCSESFYDRDTFTKHVQNKHATLSKEVHFSTGPRQCSRCNKLFISAIETKEHINKIHGRPFVCLFCDFETEDESNLKKHISNKHKNVRLISWKTSDDIVPDNEEKEGESVNDEKLCELCGLVCNEIETLVSHITTAHFKGDEYRMLQEHPRLHGITNKICCKLCNKKFQTREAVKLHLMYVHYSGNKEALYEDFPEVKVYPDTVPYICDYCEEVFPDHPTFRQHVAFEHGITLPVETKTLHILYTLTERSDGDNEADVSTKEPEREEDDVVLNDVSLDSNKFVCNGCDQFFKTKETLEIHQLHCRGIEANDEQMYETKFALSDHLAYCNSGSVNASGPHRIKPSRNKKNVCWICRSQFTDVYYLKMHMFYHINVSTLATLLSGSNSATGQNTASSSEQSVNNITAGFSLPATVRGMSGKKVGFCRVCCEYFCDLISLKVHMMSHVCLNSLYKLEEITPAQSKSSQAESLPNWDSETPQSIMSTVIAQSVLILDKTKSAVSTDPGQSSKNIDRMQSKMSTEPTQSNLSTGQTQSKVITVFAKPTLDKDTTEKKLKTCTAQSKRIGMTALSTTDLKILNYIFNVQETNFTGLQTNDTLSLPSPFKGLCKLCRQMFKLKTALKVHMMTHIDDAHTAVDNFSYLDRITEQNKLFIYECGHCFHVYSSRKRLKKHSSKEHPDLPQYIIVDIITKDDVQRDSTHHGQMQQCSYCGETIFSSKNEYLEHMQSHGVVTFRCPYCYKTGTREHIIRTHIFLEHSDLTEVMCKICRASFDHGRTLSEHMNTMHGVEVVVVGKRVNSEGQQVPTEGQQVPTEGQQEDCKIYKYGDQRSIDGRQHEEKESKVRTKRRRKKKDSARLQLKSKCFQVEDHLDHSYVKKRQLTLSDGSEGYSNVGEINSDGDTDVEIYMDIDCIEGNSESVDEYGEMEVRQNMEGTVSSAGCQIQHHKDHSYFNGYGSKKPS